MRCYIKRLPNGIAHVFYQKPTAYDFECDYDEIPKEEGVLMINEDGVFYCLGNGIIEENTINPDSPSDHEILMTLLGVTE